MIKNYNKKKRLQSVLYLQAFQLSSESILIVDRQVPETPKSTFFLTKERWRTMKFVMPKNVLFVYNIIYGKQL